MRSSILVIMAAAKEDAAEDAQQPAKSCGICKENLSESLKATFLQSASCDIGKSECILCSFQLGESICESCFIPWNREYASTISVRQNETWLIQRLRQDDQLLCLQCIIEGERGLEVWASLDKSQKKRVVTAIEGAHLKSRSRKLRKSYCRIASRVDGTVACVGIHATCAGSM